MICYRKRLKKFDQEVYNEKRVWIGLWEIKIYVYRNSNREGWENSLSGMFGEWVFELLCGI